MLSRNSARRFRPSRTRRAFGSPWLGAAAGLLAAGLLPGLAAAHPLGNFTINHYAGVRVEQDRIVLDVVIDQAEIPAFQARLGFDGDGDGELSDAEADEGRVAACRDLAGTLDLRVGRQPQTLELTEAGLSFPPGAGGLSTMRSVCGFEALLAAPIEGAIEVSFVDRSFAERLGWREIVVEGSGVAISAASSIPLRTASPSTRLTSYPAELIGQALDDTEIAITVTPGGPFLPALDIPDAEAVAGAGLGAAVDGGGSLVETGAAPGGTEPGTIDPVDAAAMAPTPAAAVPGGVAAGDLPAIFRAADLTPVVLLVSILTAAALGAGHALTPGHGKTLMAAYLVGTRGTPVHAAGLGLSVALSHTLGILGLAGLVVGAQGVLPAEVVVRTAPVVAAISIVAIGGWMLLGEVRRRRRASGIARAAERHEDHDPHDHDPHDHDPHDHEPDGHDPALAPEAHDHGGLRHTHLPGPGSSISWRSLFVLGLAGGLIPSASALLILLGAVAAGRPAFGFVLVVAFGLGMALVMGGIGLALVVARGRLDRVETTSVLGRASAYLPLVASFLVLGFGLFLTVQAVSGTSF
jgi:ABC-type nickel/cobalt efflux system permease component RcnA